MFLAEYRSRKDAVEGMYPHVVDEHLIRFFQAKPQFIDRVFIAVTPGLPVTESGHFRTLNLWQLNCLQGRISTGIRRIIRNSEILLQKSYNSIDTPLSGTSGNEKLLVGRMNAETVFTDTARCIFTDDHIACTDRFTSRYRQGGLTNAPDEILQKRSCLTGGLRILL